LLTCPIRVRQVVASDETLKKVSWVEDEICHWKLLFSISVGTHTHAHLRTHTHTQLHTHARTLTPTQENTNTDTHTSRHTECFTDLGKLNLPMVVLFKA
jgi:hypothetical protein